MFAKASIPSKSFVNANAVKCKIHIVFGEDQSVFDTEIVLGGVRIILESQTGFMIYHGAGQGSIHQTIESLSLFVRKGELTWDVAPIKDCFRPQVVDIAASSVEHLGAKVEIKFKKAEPVSWRSLVFVPSAEDAVPRLTDDLDNTDLDDVEVLVNHEANEEAKKKFFQQGGSGQ